MICRRDRRPASGGSAAPGARNKRPPALTMTASLCKLEGKCTHEKTMRRQVFPQAPSPRGADRCQSQRRVARTGDGPPGGRQATGGRVARLHPHPYEPCKPGITGRTDDNELAPERGVGHDADAEGRGRVWKREGGEVQVQEGEEERREERERGARCGRKAQSTQPFLLEPDACPPRFRKTDASQMSGRTSRQNRAGLLLQRDIARRGDWSTRASHVNPQPRLDLDSTL